MKRLRGVLALLVLAGAIVVLAGLGQGSPPKGQPLSAANVAASKMRVAAGSGAVRTGQEIFRAQRCGSCHTIAASDTHGQLGPRLDAALKGTPRDVIESFITDPKTVMIPGYDNHLMSRDYKRRISAGGIRALASYLHAAAG